METTEMNIPRLMEITQPTREQLIELLDGTEKLRQELEAENKLSRSAWLDAKADKLRMDYLGYDDETGEPGDTCSICRLDYSGECECPGPTQDGMEYETFHGVLMARPILGENTEKLR